MQQVEIIIETDIQQGLVVEQKALDAVLFHFNPSQDRKVERIKVLCAALIQEMHDLQDAESSTSAMKRTAAIAITQAEIVQMLAVKANFAK